MSTIARVFGVLLLVGGSLLALPLSFASASTVNIAVSGTIGQYWFCNSSYQSGNCPTTISVGDTVQWNFNGDIYSAHSTRHCSAGCTGSPTGGTPIWDSPIANVQTFSYTFTSPGTYQYQCEVHPLDMQGTITVLASVGGESQLARVTAPQSHSHWLNAWIGLSAIGGGLIVLVGTGWSARRLAARHPDS